LRPTSPSPEPAVMRRCLRLALPLLLLLPLSCKKSEGYTLAKVSGKVTIDRGKGPEALAGAMVTFTPKDKGPDGKELPRSQATTGEDGSYTLKVVETDPKTTPRDGAVVGEHRVEVELIERTEKGIVHLTPQKYRGPNSELSFKVPEGGTSEA